MVTLGIVNPPKQYNCAIPECFSLPTLPVQVKLKYNVCILDMEFADELSQAANEWFGFSKNIYSIPVQNNPIQMLDSMIYIIHSL